MEWFPKTKLGRMVKAGEIKTMSDALKVGLPFYPKFGCFMST